MYDHLYTKTRQKLDRSFREFPDHCSLKAIVYIEHTVQSKLESYVGEAVQRLTQAQLSSWQLRVERSPHMTISYTNIRHPQKDQEQQRVRHLWQPNPVRNSTSAINSYFLLWVPHKVGNVFCPTNFRTQSYLV